MVLGIYPLPLLVLDFDALRQRSLGKHPPLLFTVSRVWPITALLPWQLLIDSSSPLLPTESERERKNEALSGEAEVIKQLHCSRDTEEPGLHCRKLQPDWRNEIPAIVANIPRIRQSHHCHEHLPHVQCVGAHYPTALKFVWELGCRHDEWFFKSCVLSSRGVLLLYSDQMHHFHCRVI